MASHMSLNSSANCSSQQYLSTVQSLNKRWNLGLPESLELDRTIILDNTEKLLQRDCVRLLHFLGRHPSFRLDSILDDYAQAAETPTMSQWVPKPSQEKGTLPPLRVSKPFVNRDGDRSNMKTSPVEHSRRAGLNSLLRLLEEHKQLANESDVYTGSIAASDLPKSSSSHVQGCTTSPKRWRPQDSCSSEKPNKKRKGADDSNHKSVRLQQNARPSRIPTGQTTLDLERKRPLPLEHSAADALKCFPQNVSFESMVSDAPSSVFSAPLCDRPSWSSHSSFTDELEATPAPVESPQVHPKNSRQLTFPGLDACETEEVNARLLQEIIDHGPCRVRSAAEELPRNLPFRLRYECHRISKTLSMPIQQFFRAVSTKCKTERPELGDLWKAARELSENAGTFQALLPSEKSSLLAWDNAEGNFITATRKSVVLGGSLAWADATGKGLFDLKLNRLQVEKSSRFERRFGSDRIIALTLPDLSRDVPQHLRRKAANLQSVVSRWLGQTTQHIAGRHWRAFYVESIKKKCGSATLAGFKVFFFAVDGVDMLPQKLHGSDLLGGPDSAHRTKVTLKEFIDWYMPIQANISTSDKKLFQRLKLGLSKTIPTVVLFSEEFVDFEDDPSWRSTMNDGCARMSRKLAQEVSRHLGIDYTPSVFQGRIAGAKGLWMVENDEAIYPGASKRRGFWLEITSSSQLKIFPHPKDCPDADPENRTIEILAWSKSAKPAALTTQLIPILHHGGITKEQIEKHVRENTQSYYDNLTGAMKDPRLLRDWTRQNEPTNSERALLALGCFPRDQAAQINFLLESGFTPGDNDIVVSILRNFLKSYLERYVERMHFQIDLATSVWCVPDPYGILEEGEIQLNFSEPFQCPDKQTLSTLWNRDCLVYRSPGYLPSDVQRVRGVFRPELMHLLDVVVFSTKGATSLASKLSGGDYDGDKVWVCFDQSIVRSFQNTPVELKPPSEADCGLGNESRKVAEIFSPDGPTAAELDDFFVECFNFNLQTPMLGQCSVQHEMIAYHRSKGIADPGALLLAALSGFLVDAAKQGYSLSTHAWKGLKIKTSGKHEFSIPAFKTNSEAKLNPNSIIDYLKLIVATNEKDRLLSQFQRDWPQHPRYDITLSTPFREQETKFKIAHDHVGQEILRQLRKDIDTLKNDFLDMSRSRDQGDQYENHIMEMHEKAQTIQPRADQNHDLCRRFEDEKHEQFSNWSRLRASCLYYRWPNGWSVWYAVGTDLAKIKADASGSTRIITTSMHGIMKPDRNAIERMTLQVREDIEENSFDPWDSFDQWDDD